MRGIAGLAGAVAMLAAAPGAGAATITVDTATDELNGDADCSLREAVQAANLNAGNTTGCVNGTSTPDLIVLGGSHALTLTGSSDDTNARGDLDISATGGELTVQADGTATIDATLLAERAIDARGDSLELIGVTIAGGREFGGNGGNIRVPTAGDSLTLDGATVEGGNAGNGGGVYSLGPVTIENGSVVTDNIATNVGGGIWFAASGETLSVSDSEVTLNDSGSNGAGIHRFDGSVQVAGSTISGNIAGGVGGGIYAAAGTGTLEVAASLIASNQANASVAASGGGINTTIGYSLDRVILAENRASNVAGDFGALGGGLFTTASGTITDSVIRDNFARSGVMTGGNEVSGGGLAVTGGSAITTTIERTSVVGNAVLGPAAILRGGGASLRHTVDIRNSTIAGNSVTGATSQGHRGGGLYAEAGGAATTDVDLVHVTLRGNDAADSGDGALASDQGGSAEISFRESVIDGDACAVLGTATVTSSDWNVDSGTSCTGAGASNDLQSTSAGTAAPADNGGTEAGPAGGAEVLPTAAIGVGSDATDHIPASDCTDDGVTFNGGVQDQRGFPRPDGGQCDAGAYEVIRCGSVEATIVGSPDDDVIDGTPGDDVIVAGVGEDAISGLAGNDRICAGDDDDLIIPGPGDDTVSGDAGDDTVTYFDAPNGVEIDLAAGEATGHGSDLLSVDNATGSPHDDLIVGDVDDDVLQGGGGDDEIEGLDGNDAISGGAGVDTASYEQAPGQVSASLAAGSAPNDGHGGSDTLGGVENLTGSANPDQIQGNSGPNLLHPGADSANDQLDGLAGADTVSFAGGDPVDANLDTGSATGQGNDTITGFFHLTGTDGDDTLTGSAISNVIAGGAGDDTVAGLEDNDTLDGGTGTDTLDHSASPGGIIANLGTGSIDDDGYGDTDDLDSFENVIGSSSGDAISGDGGPNLLSGGAGNDMLTGGAGADAVLGGGDDDSLKLRDGVADTGDCGPGTDSVETDQPGVDTLTACEAVDALPAPAPPPPVTTPPAASTPPSNALDFGKLKRNKKKGIALLFVNLPGPGEIGLAGKGIETIGGAGIARASRLVSGGRVKLKVRPAKGKKGRKLRQRLRDKGKAKVKVRVSYVPSGGAASTRVKKLKLIRK